MKITYLSMFILIAILLMAVSYTHLDVYKRQHQNYRSLFDETLKLVEDGKTTVSELLKISYYER